MTAPAVLIRLELEEAPRLQVDALNERDHDRIIDWIASHPAYADLVERAIALERQERPA